eukprot:gene4879-3493_t
MFLPPPPLPRGSLKGVGGNQPPLVGLPPNLRMMFDPITPLEFKPPAEKRPGVLLAGVASLLTNFENTAPPERKPFIPPVEAKKIAQERLQKLHQEKNELLVQDWDPHNNPKATGNAFATVFVSRLSYDTNEKKLRRDFELYGPIRSIRVVHDTEGKSRGYAFIEYETEKDAEAAVRKSEGKRIEGRRIVCDVERGRTVKNWRPMRFGGGVGGRPAKKSKKTLDEEALKAATVSAGATTAASSDDHRGGGDRGDRGDRGGGDRGGGDRGGGDRGGGDRGRGGRSRSRDRRGGGGGGGGDRDRERSRDRDHYRGGDRDRERDRDGPRGGDRDGPRDRDRYHSRERGPPPPRERERDAYGSGYGSSRGGGSGGGGGGGGHYGPAGGGGSNGGGGRRDNSRDRGGGGGGGPRGRSRDRR